MNICSAGIIIVAAIAEVIIVDRAAVIVVVVIIVDIAAAAVVVVQLGAGWLPIDRDAQIWCIHEIKEIRFR